jgi:iron transport multicopper oxidase
LAKESDLDLARRPLQSHLINQSIFSLLVNCKAEIVYSFTSNILTCIVKMFSKLSVYVAVVASLFAAVTQAAVVEQTWTVSWMTGAPDGYTRSVIGINGQWPPPTLYADEGDTLLIHVHNDLGNQSTSIHFHGMFQNGTTIMDGSAGVSHCAIPAGSSMDYKFTAIQSGTYWYHSHVLGQYPDGLRAPFIIRPKELPFTYDEELIVTLSDWYHDLMEVLTPKFLNLANPTGAEPIPDSNLMNDTQNLKINVQPGKTYLVRFINVGAFVGQYVWFEGHTMSIVEVDGVYTEPADANMIYLGVAQRYGVLITTKTTTDTNFAIVSAFDEVSSSSKNCFALLTPTDTA